MNEKYPRRATSLVQQTIAPKWRAAGRTERENRSRSSLCGCGGTGLREHRRSRQSGGGSAGAVPNRARHGGVPAAGRAGLRGTGASSWRSFRRTWEGSTAKVYLSLTDTTGSLFGDAAPDLYDSWSLDYASFGSGARSYGCSTVDYDPNTHTATYFLQIDDLNGKHIPAGAFQFSFNQLLIGREKQEGVPVTADLSAVPKTHRPRTIQSTVTVQ